MRVLERSIAGGATLRQDSVVREWLPWKLDGAQPATLRLTARTCAPWAGVALTSRSR